MSSDSSSAAGDDSRILAAYHEALVGDSDNPSSSTADSDNLTGALHVLRMMERARRSEIEAPVEPSGESKGYAQDSPVDFSNDHANRIGRFEIVRKLGEGGNGTVLLVVDPKLDRQVALKVPNPETLFNHDFTERFRREAQLTARLRHPNIVSVYETGSIGPVSYIASAYCNGPTLASWLKQHGNRFTPNNAARLMRALADAVQHAHSRGILHRDIKPSNILFDFADEASLSEIELAEAARLGDFGLAKQLADDTTLTAAAAVLGTPAYMAPEQADGRLDDVGTHSDIFSLGCVLHELLTGQAPFRRDSTLATLQAVRSEEPKQSTRSWSHVPRDLAAICLKCLEKNPKDRYGSATALSTDLDAFLNNRPVLARPMTLLQRVHRWARRNKALASLVSAVAFMSLALLFGSIAFAWKLSESNESVRDALQQERTASHKATASEQKAQETLLDSLLVQAMATRKSPQAGHRLDTLQTVKRAVSLSHHLEVFDDYKRPLRNEAIMATSLWDVRPSHRWPNETWESTRSLLMQSRFANRDQTLYATIAPRTKDVVVKRIDDDSIIGTYSCATDEQIYDIVGDVQWSPDGKYITARTRRRNRQLQLLVWDCETAQIVAQFDLAKISGETAMTSRKQHDFSNDGKLLALCTPRRVKIVDVGTWTVTQRHNTGSDPRVVEFDPSSSQLAISLFKKTMIIDLDEPGTVRTLPTTRSYKMAWSEKGSTLAIATTDKTIQVWNLEEETSFTLHGHAQVVTTVAFLPEDRFLITGSWDGTTRIWDLREEDEILVIEGEVFDQLSEDGHSFSTSQGVLEILQPTRKLVATEIDDSRTPYPASPHWFSKHPALPLLAMSSHEYLTLLNSTTHDVLFSAKVHGRCEFNRDGSALWFGLQNLGARAKAPRYRVPIRIDETDSEFRVHCELETDVPLPVSPEMDSTRSGNRSEAASIFAYSKAGESRVFKLDMNDESIQTSEDLAYDYQRICMSPDGTTLIGLAASRKRSEIIDFETGEQLRIVVEGRNFRFRPDSQFLVFESDDGTRFFARDNRDWKLVQLRRNRAVSTMASGFSQNGKLVAISGTSPGTVDLVDTVSYETHATLSLFDRQFPRSAWFSPDARKLILALRDPRKIEVWNLDSVREEIRGLGLQWDEAQTSNTPLHEPLKQKPLRLYLAKGSMLEKAAKAEREAKIEKEAAATTSESR